MSINFIKITLSNYDAIVKTLEHLKNRINCQNRTPSSREKITIQVIEQEKIEIESVLRLHGYTREISAQSTVNKDGYSKIAKIL